jgi:hypothetical protein
MWVLRGHMVNGQRGGGQGRDLSLGAELSSKVLKYLDDLKSKSLEFEQIIPEIPSLYVRFGFLRNMYSWEHMRVWRWGEHISTWISKVWKSEMAKEEGIFGQDLPVGMARYSSSVPSIW